MALPTVHIRREALCNMLTTVVEPFKREGVGNLYGYCPTRSRNRYLIISANAVACVSTRKNTEVERTELSFQRCKGLYDSAPLLFRYIGDFHSHPEWGEKKGLLGLSEGEGSDVADMRKRGYELELIIVISTRKGRHIPWRQMKDSCIRGSLGDYIFKIGAFTLEEELQEDGTKKPIPVILKIVAPAAIKALNRVNFPK